jgi:hypothetical protein
MMEEKIISQGHFQLQNPQMTPLFLSQYSVDLWAFNFKDFSIPTSKPNFRDFLFLSLTE